MKGNAVGPLWADFVEKLDTRTGQAKKAEFPPTKVYLWKSCLQKCPSAERYSEIRVRF